MIICIFRKHNGFLRDRAIIYLKIKNCQNWDSFNVFPLNIEFYMISWVLGLNWIAFGILKFVYPYDQFYTISWVLGLNWIALWALYQIRGPSLIALWVPYQIRGPSTPHQNIEFYMISWVLGLNWIALWTLYQIRGPSTPHQNIEDPVF